MDSLHDERLERAHISLEGLSVGDAFGEQFFYALGRHQHPVEDRILRPPPWEWTDDTNMALSIFAVLRQSGTIDEERLAESFRAHYDQSRGYGASLSRLLRTAGDAQTVLRAAAAQFEGQGSHGNGAAMRVPPLGAYFADDLELLADQARRSAVVTHAHPEAIAGAIAVALAAAYAWRLRGQPAPACADFLDLIVPHLPMSEVRSKIQRARSLAADLHVQYAAVMLGNGVNLSAQDTVPFTLWCVGQQLASYEAAVWLGARGLGDMDTICAMVGGIVVLYTGLEGLPLTWRQAREPLPPWPFDEVAGDADR